MTRLVAFATLAILLTLSAQTAARAQAAQTEVVAVIEKITGKAYWRPSLDKPQQPLDSSRDAGRPIHFKEWVMVPHGCSLKVWTARDNTPIEQTVSTPDKWVTFAHRPSAEQLSLLTVLTDASLLGGRSRDARLYSPANGSAVRLSRLSIYWTPTSPNAIVSLKLTSEATGRAIWSASAVRGRAGTINAGPVRAAIAAAPAEVREMPLVMTISDGSAPTKSTFRLLARKQESEIETRLRRWNGANAMLRHSARIAELCKGHLFNDAAAEYEAALAGAPESTTLLIATIVAEEGIGNVQRGRVLRARLPRGTFVPGDDLPLKSQ